MLCTDWSSPMVAPQLLQQQEHSGLCLVAKQIRQRANCLVVGRTVVPPVNTGGGFSGGFNQCYRAAPQTLNKTLSSQQLSWDSTKGLHLHMDQPTDAPEGEGSGPAATAEVGDEGGEPLEREHAEDKVPKPQPRCEICGITTTSQAHMEVSLPAATRVHCLQKRMLPIGVLRPTWGPTPHLERTLLLPQTLRAVTPASQRSQAWPFGRWYAASCRLTWLAASTGGGLTPRRGGPPSSSHPTTAPCATSPRPRRRTWPCTWWAERIDAARRPSRRASSRSRSRHGSAAMTTWKSSVTLPASLSASPHRALLWQFILGSMNFGVSDFYTAYIASQSNTAFGEAVGGMAIKYAVTSHQAVSCWSTLMAERLRPLQTCGGARGRVRAAAWTMGSWAADCAASWRPLPRSLKRTCTAPSTGELMHPGRPHPPPLSAAQQRHFGLCDCFIRGNDALLDLI